MGSDSYLSQSKIKVVKEEFDSCRAIAKIAKILRTFSKKPIDPAFCVMLRDNLGLIIYTIFR